MAALLVAAAALAILGGVYLAVRVGKGRELALATAATLIALLISESTLRVLGVTGYHLPRTREWSHALAESKDRPPGVQIQFKPNSSFRFCYDSDPREYFDSDHCLTYFLNNFGFRDDDYTLAKPSGFKRVVVLGDSFTFGEGVRPEHMFSNLLEKRLASSGIDVEVLNFSVGGWGTRDETAYLEAQGLDFSPDLVIVAYVLNDADYAGGLDVWEGFRHQYEKSWLRFSAVLSFLYARLGQRLYVRRYVEGMTEQALREESKWTSSFRDLSRGEKLAKASGARFAVVILPFMYDLTDDYPFRSIHRMIESYCRSEEIPVRDLFPAFSGSDYVDLWVHASDPHPNEQGHRIIADALFEFLRDERLLGRSE